MLKNKYGQTSEVVNANVQEIMGLPTIQNSNPGRIHAFYQKLSTYVQALETRKLWSINAYVRLTLDRLPRIRSDLVRLDDDWKKREFPHLVEALKKWTERNTVSEIGKKKESIKSEKTYKTIEKPMIQKHTATCIYCNQERHKANECESVKDITERRRILSSKQRCFNCARGGHRASNCSSRGCFKCGKRHHTSICDFKEDTKGATPETSKVDKMMCSTYER